MIICLTRGAKDYNVVFTFNRNFVRKNTRMASQYWDSDFSWADSNYSVLAFIETACHVGAIIVRKHYSKIHEHSNNNMLKGKPPYKKCKQGDIVIRGGSTQYLFSPNLPGSQHTVKLTMTPVEY